MCQCRRRSGALSGTTTACPVPRWISWLHPGQMYCLWASKGCTRLSSARLPVTGSSMICVDLPADLAGGAGRGAEASEAPPCREPVPPVLLAGRDRPAFPSLRRRLRGGTTRTSLCCLEDSSRGSSHRACRDARPHGSRAGSRSRGVPRRDCHRHERAHLLPAHLVGAPAARDEERYYRLEAAALQGGDATRRPGRIGSGVSPSWSQG